MNSSLGPAVSESFLDFFVAENSHPVLRNWFLVSSPWPSVATSILYLLFALVIGPAFMANKKPYEIKGIMNLYNVVQVVSNVYFLHGYWTNGWGSYYNWACQPVDMDPDPNSMAMRFNLVSYHGYLFRYVDMCDTFFFVARKKYRNVNVLQLFHHAVMPIFGWMLVYWTPNGHESFGQIVNALVHAIMYTYYFLAAMEVDRKYLWWKRYLTQLQLIQFVSCLLKSVVVIAGISDCGFPWQTSLVSVTLALMLIGLFGHFYVQEYTLKKKGGGSAKSD